MSEVQQLILDFRVFLSILELLELRQDFICLRWALTTGRPALNMDWQLEWNSKTLKIAFSSHFNRLALTSSCTLVNLKLTRVILNGDVAL